MQEAQRGGLALTEDQRMLYRTILHTKLTIIRGPAGPVPKTSSHLLFLTADFSSRRRAGRVIGPSQVYPAAPPNQLHAFLLSLHMTLRGVVLREGLEYIGREGRKDGSPSSLLGKALPVWLL